MARSTISIVVPIYNVEQYLRRCIDSLLRQIYEDIEILLINDGSTDRSLDICYEYAEKDERIKVYSKDNGGLGSARNFGVEKSNSNWIIFVDSDDYVSPNYVRNLVALKNKYNVDIVSCRPTYVDDEGNVLKAYNDFNPFVINNSQEAIWELYFGSFGFISAWAKLFPKDLLLEFPFPDGYYEDFACLYKIVSKCKGIVFANNCYDYLYVQREGSILNSKLNKSHLEGFTICDDIANYMQSYYPKIFKYSFLLYQRQVIQILNKQRLDIESFNYVFRKYRFLFRRNLIWSIVDKRIDIKKKIYTSILCTSPNVYKLVKKIFK